MFDALAEAYQDRQYCAQWVRNAHIWASRHGWSDGAYSQLLEADYQLDLACKHYRETCRAIIPAMPIWSWRTLSLQSGR